MKNKELFTLNPEQINLKNEGVAKVRAINEPEDYAMAEYELRTFVCEGEYHEGLRKMLESYLDNFDKKDRDLKSFLSKLSYGFRQILDNTGINNKDNPGVINIITEVSTSGK